MNIPPNAYLYIYYSILGVVQGLQNMPNRVLTAQRIKIRTPEIQMEYPQTGPKNKGEMKKL